MPSPESQGSADGLPSPGERGAPPGVDPPASGEGVDHADGGADGTPGAPGGVPASSGGLPGASGGGDFTLDTLPGGGVFQGSVGAGQQGADGGMTAAQRAAVLDEQLRRTYEIYDEVLRREQAEARGIENPGGSGGGPSPPDGGSDTGARQADAAGAPNGAGGASDENPRDIPSPPGGGRDQQPTYPPPEDIPSGRDDDVVARQLREAAMTEPDPVLREALWDEYRNYTGIETDR